MAFTVINCYVIVRSDSRLPRNAEPGAVPSGIRRGWRAESRQRRLSGYACTFVVAFLAGKMIVQLVLVIFLTLHYVITMLNITTL